jgi:hypothetical protein
LSPRAKGGRLALIPHAFAPEASMAITNFADLLGEARLQPEAVQIG